MGDNKAFLSADSGQESKDTRTDKTTANQKILNDLNDHFDLFGDAILPQKGFTPTEEFRGKQEFKPEKFELYKEPLKFERRWNNNGNQ
ncbi:MAG TPA: hypothetical protein PKC98_09140, partial [Candidatus Melainabacteria bacterium]|nr:hypothetical protein [Candidatus Melainabacteria bacterium]